MRQGRAGQDSMGEQRVRMVLFTSAAYRSMMGYGSGPPGGTVGTLGCPSQVVCGSGCQSLCAILLFLFNRLAMLTRHRPYPLGLLGKFRSPKKESANCEVLAYLYGRLHAGA